MRVYFIDDNAIFLLGIVFLLFLVFGLFLSQGVPNGVASKGDTALLNNSSGQITQFPIMSVPCFFLVVSFYKPQNPNFPQNMSTYFRISEETSESWKFLYFRAILQMICIGRYQNIIMRVFIKEIFLTERKYHHGWTTLPNQSARKSRLNSNLKIGWLPKLLRLMYFVTRKCSFVLNENSIPKQWILEADTGCNNVV